MTFNSVLRSAIASVLLLSAGAMEPSRAQSAVSAFDLPQQSLVDSLRSIASQTQQNVFFDPQTVAGRQAPPLRAALSAEEALSRILEGTGLTYRYVDANTVSIVPDQPSAAPMQTISNTGEEQTRVWRLAQAQQGERSSADAANPVDGQLRLDGWAPEERRARSTYELEEVMVTGSHIRGVQNHSSPVLHFDRTDIERSGYSSTQQFIHSLTQNLGNVTDTTVNALNGGDHGGATFSGSGINLRGMGSDATLVLLNGRRMSATYGSFVDISLIPLSAIERIDVLTDGASAIYGSDAVGGVVNIVLRKDFEGAETRARFGSVTEGSHRELQAGQLVGHSWNSGHALIGYEHFQRSALDADERDFTPLGLGGIDAASLVPEQRRSGAFATISQRLSPRLELSADVFYGNRHSESDSEAYRVPRATMYSVEQFGGSLALDMALQHGWQIKASGLLDESRAETASYNKTTGVPSRPYGNDVRLSSIDVGADGPVLDAPGGHVRMALGGQYRSERLVDRDRFSPGRLDRSISAAYAELLVPWIGEPNRQVGAEALEMTLAGRFEEYSDFGSTFNPKVGMSWVPTDGLNIRATWGKSFKAPLLRQMNASSFNPQAILGGFIDASGSVTGISVGGSGVNLQPEKSENWSAGFDLTLPEVPDLRVSATYFDVNYDERVRGPLPAEYDIFGVLLDPMYSVIVTRNPDPAYVASLMAHPNFVCFDLQAGAYCANSPAPGDVSAIVDTRLRNLSGVSTSGVDLSASYRITSGFGDWDLQLSGTRLLSYRERFMAGSPQVSRMNTVWQPVDLRLRQAITFSRKAFQTSLFINYVDGYQDRRDPMQAGPGQRGTVASWTTVDLSMRYDLSASAVKLGELSLMVSALNVLDRDPPFVANIQGLNYDGANANPIGRFLSAQLTLKW